MMRHLPYWPRLKAYCFLVSMPIIICMLHLIMFGSRAFRDPQIFIFSSLIIFVLGSASMTCHIAYDDYAERRFPSLQQTRHRIVLKSLLTLFVMAPSICIIFFIYSAFDLFGYRFQYEDLWQGTLVGFSVNLIFETLFEADFVFRKKREADSESSAWQDLSMSEELDLLKNQINPHFLFNCLNTLSALIGTDKQRALIFLDELSKVYRILLKANTDSLNTLDRELAFVESYFKLLQMRHSESLRLKIQVDPQFLKYLLPAMSLQLLIENAVKHNKFSKSAPMSVEIFTSGENKLVVNNTLQRKNVISHSHGIGLQNIRTKYELLEEPGFQIMESEQNFTVVLPLLWLRTTPTRQPNIPTQYPASPAPRFVFEKHRNAK